MLVVSARRKFLSSLYQHIHQEALTFVHSESQDKRRFGINSIRDFETLKMACECKSPNGLLQIYLIFVNLVERN